MGFGGSAAIALLLLLAPLRVAPASTRQEEPPARDEDAKLDTWFRDYIEASFVARPTFATRLGEHRFDSQLDDLSKQARTRNLARDKAALADLSRQIDHRKLTHDGRVDFDIVKRDLERSIWLAEHFDPFVDDPRIWGEYITESVYLLLAQSTLDRETNVANAVERMKAIPRVLGIARETIGAAAKVKVETAIAQTQGAISFYEKDIYTFAGRDIGDQQLAGPAAAILDALREHADFLKNEVLPRSSDDAWRIGPVLFAQKLDLELDAGISAEEVLAEAEREAARVEAELAVVARQLWWSLYPGRPVPPDDTEGRRELIRAVLAVIGDERSTASSVLSDVKHTVGEIKEFIRANGILRLPEPDQCAIIEMPEFMRGNSTAYLNPAPPLDPRARSEYAVSPPPASWSDARVESYFREYNKQMLRILSIHEGYPGHYVQLEYSNRCPSFIRRVLGSGTFAEGWAVYTEQMMLDQGYGAGDLRLRMQQLKFYLRAVVNAILDYKMHCANMSDDEAMKLLVDRAFQNEGEAVGKIIRAKQSSCQLSTYFVGRTAFHRLRQEIQREMGDRFELAAYHEAVLAHGTIPVKHVPNLVRRSLGLPVVAVGLSETGATRGATP